MNYSAEITLKERLKAIRLYFQENMQSFAKKLKVSQGYISEIESGKKKPSKLFLHAVALTFNINDGWLLHGRGEMLRKQHYLNVVGEKLVPYAPESPAEEIEALKTQLIGTDSQMVRVFEECLHHLIENKMLDINKMTIESQELLSRRRILRSRIKSLKITNNGITEEK